MDWETDLIALAILAAVALLYRRWEHSVRPGEHPSLYRAFAISGGQDPTTFAPTEDERSGYRHPRRGLQAVLHDRRYLITD